METKWTEIGRAEFVKLGMKPKRDRPDPDYISGRFKIAKFDGVRFKIDGDRKQALMTDPMPVEFRAITYSADSDENHVRIMLGTKMMDIEWWNRHAKPTDVAGCSMCVIRDPPEGYIVYTTGISNNQTTIDTVLMARMRLNHKQYFTEEGFIAIQRKTVVRSGRESVYFNALLLCPAGVQVHLKPSTLRTVVNDIVRRVVDDHSTPYENESTQWNAFKHCLRRWSLSNKDMSVGKYELFESFETTP